MEWISIKHKDIDLDTIHFLVDGDSIYLVGPRIQPFFVQLCGEMKPIYRAKFSHWMPLPKIPLPKPPENK